MNFVVYRQTHRIISQLFSYLSSQPSQLYVFSKCSQLASQLCKLQQGISQIEHGCVNIQLTQFYYIQLCMHVLLCQTSDRQLYIFQLLILTTFCMGRSKATTRQYILYCPITRAISIDITWEGGFQLSFDLHLICRLLKQKLPNLHIISDTQ